MWHKKDREAAKVPHTSIDTEAHWTKSGWHGWVYGWKLHLATTTVAGGVWIPLAARLTPANEADSRLAAELYYESCPAKEARFVLGDTHYTTLLRCASCARGRIASSWWPRGTGPTRTPMRGLRC